MLFGGDFRLGLQILNDRICAIAAIANGPHYQGRTAHDITHGIDTAQRCTAGFEFGFNGAPTGDGQVRFALQCWQILRFKTQGCDDQIGVFDIFRAFDHFW